MNLIRYFRKQNGYTQNDLCKKLGVTQGALSGWETGRYEPDTASLIKMANIFDTTIDYLLGRTDSPKAQYSSSDKLNLSSTEEHVVTTFRKLTPEDQNYIVKTIDIVSAQYPSEENTYDIAAFKSHKHINIEDEE